MQTSDISKLIRLVREAASVSVIGQMPVAISEIVKGKLVDISAADLVVVNVLSHRQVISALRDIAHNCTIFVCDAPNVGAIMQFTDNVPNLQQSRQMLVDGIREDSLVLRYTNRIVELDRVDPISIFLVLRTGGDVFSFRYVNACIANIKKHITYPHEIVCLTDNPKGIVGADRIVYMRHNWSKWWGKIELFRDDITTNKHCLYLDLDTVCLKNIDDICKLPYGFYGLRDFNVLDVLQTGVLKWDVTEYSTDIYKSFVNEDFSKYTNKGDHEWIGAYAPKHKFLQDCFPDEIASYKTHISRISKGDMKPTIVCFHGIPRPHTVTDNFITNEWKY